MLLGVELGMEEKMMGMGSFEAGTHTTRVQNGSGGPAGLKPRSVFRARQGLHGEEYGWAVMVFWGSVRVC